MKIIIANKYFYPRGGDCMAVIRTKKLLEKYGHDVLIYSMSHPDNINLDEDDLFASYVNFSGSVKDKVKGIKRIIGKGDIKRSFEKVIRDFSPDVVHLHNVHSYLSPVIGELASKYGIRIVWTLHDYKLICPAYTMKNDISDDCKECFGGCFFNVVKNRCMHSSLLWSLTGYAEAKIWNKKRLEKFVDTFICPSFFMKEKMKEAGFSENKLKVLSNFFDENTIETEQKYDKEEYFCYAGRLSEEKGVLTLLEATADAGVKLKVAGSGPLSEYYINEFSSFENIEFVGNLDAEGVRRLMSKSLATILPSEWNENNPVSIIESFIYGTPVIGASRGGITEMIDNENGILFESGNKEELSDILRSFKDTYRFDSDTIKNTAKKKYSSAKHYDKLMEIYIK